MDAHTFDGGLFFYMDIKIGDVFSFRYKDDLEDKYRKNHLDLYHCFDGQLVAKQGKETIYLEDTFWSSDSRKFTIEEAKEKGVLEFKFNISEVEQIEEHYVKYFSDEDVFTFHCQKGCRKRFVKKLNAPRSKEKMIEEITSKINEQQRDIEYKLGEVERLKLKLDQVNNGDLSIYF